MKILAMLMILFGGIVNTLFFVDPAIQRMGLATAIICGLIPVTIGFSAGHIYKMRYCISNSSQSNDGGKNESKERCN